MTIAEQFIEALERLESTGEVEPIASLFADDAELTNPTLWAPKRGPAGAHDFWATYRASFRSIESTFRVIVESAGASMLEWQSYATGRDGSALSYDGVTVLEHRDGVITRFRAYFDPRALGSGLARAA